MKPLLIVGVYLLLMLLMYVPPYTVLADSSPLMLYAYWAAVALSALIAAVVMLKRQER